MDEKPASAAGLSALQRSLLVQLYRLLEQGTACPFWGSPIGSLSYPSAHSRWSRAHAAGLSRALPVARRFAPLLNLTSPPARLPQRGPAETASPAGR
jgi:hypothetical protein